MIINSNKDFMKKITPNLIIDLQNNISIQRPTSTFIKRISFIVVFLFFSASISAQNGNTVTPKIIEVKTYISSLKTVEQNMNLSFSNAQNVENLIYILSSTTTTEQNIAKMFHNYEEQYSIFYKIEKGE